MRWVVTGGAGFIGSHFVRTAVLERDGWEFIKGICNREDVETGIDTETDAVLHFAAKSHVDRSILSAADFVRTNVLGTQVLLDVARHRGVNRFVHISTDEVYGSLALDDPIRFTETNPLNPTSPYAASKANADHLVLAAHRTHGLDVAVTCCSNNYGPYQFPEKFIPLFVTHALEGAPLPLYGDGRNVRDWIHVEDHIHGVFLAWKHGQSGDVYNSGGDCERANKDIAMRIVELLKVDPALIRRATDRPAHDMRYATDAIRAKEELGWHPGPNIDERLFELIAWYCEHQNW